MLKTLSLLTAVILFACIVGCSDYPDYDSILDPPQVTGLNPAANDSSVLAGSSITATFDRKMWAATDSNFMVYGFQNGKASGAYAGDGSDTLSFDAADPFKAGEEVEVILTRLLTSFYGISLQSPFVYRFRIETLGGTGDFTPADTVGGQSGVLALAAGDWDSNGDLDLAAGNEGADQVAILENDGTGDFTPADTVAGQTGIVGLMSGDWDGDGDLDLAAANFGGDRVDILENDGSGNFTPADTVAGQTGVYALAAGDWDGDGDLDLAAGNFLANRVDILENDGTGDFTAADTVAGQDRVHGLAAGDWDGDDDLDLAAANNLVDTVAVLENQN